MSAPYDLHESFGYRMTLLSRINERAFEAKIADLGISRIMWCILLGVGQESVVHPSAIATYVGIDRTATSRALRAMETRGLITRSNGAADGRTTEVAITDTGRQILSQATAAARDNASWYTHKLTQAELAQFGQLLDKLLRDETRGVSRL